MGRDARVSVAGEELILMPERTVYWARRGMLIAADLHWGKAAAFRAASVAVPSGTTRDDLERLDGALKRTGARRLVLLGDLLHARAGRAPRTLERIAEWRGRHREVEILLVRGNHDARAGDPPEEWGIRVLDEPHGARPFSFAHFPEGCGAGYGLAGHVHPAVVLRDGAGWSERLPCFYFGRTGGVLPAFGSFTGTHAIRPRRGDRVFVLADGEVIRVG